METKERQEARRLVEKFYDLMAVAIAGAKTIQWPMAKKAAAFHVQEIIDELDAIKNQIDDSHVMGHIRIKIDHLRIIQKEINEL